MCKRLIYLTSFVLVLVAFPPVTHAQVDNLALNPSFEEDEVILDDPDWYQWCTWNPEEVTGSNATIVDTESIDGTRSLRVDPIGVENWHFVVANISFPLKVGIDFTATFWAKAEAPRPLGAQMKAADNSVSWGYTDFQLTTEWAEYTMTSQAESDEGKLEFFCAGVEVPHWLDFVYVYEGEYVAGIEPGASTRVKATAPEPVDGAIHPDTWASLSWKPGDHAVSHDVYIGDNLEDVNNGAEGTFIGNQAATFIVVGFPGFPYPDGLVPGATYYWRIEEVNDADPNSPWKGDVWSFSIPPKTAYAPNPADGAESVNPNVELSWTAGFGAKLHYVYFGDNFDNVSNAAGGLPQGISTYTPSTLKLAKTYYWRVDEFDAVGTYKGEVWSFTTQGGVGSPDPSNGAVDVKQTQILTWSPSVYA
ncbi:MAG: carbohydrate binding domain-containing protein, partial [Sedimentisphaerales bacterium]